MQKTEIVIRPAAEEDLDTVYQMICVLEETILDREGFSAVYQSNLKNPNIHYFLAQQEETPIGFASLHVEQLLHHASKVGELQELVILPQCRGLGVGRKLLETVENTAKRCGCTQLEVCANVRRESAHRFYERFGLVNDHVNLCKPLSGK